MKLLFMVFSVVVIPICIFLIIIHDSINTKKRVGRLIYFLLFIIVLYGSLRNKL